MADYFPGATQHGTKCNFGRTNPSGWMRSKINALRADPQPRLSVPCGAREVRPGRNPEAEVHRRCRLAFPRPARAIPVDAFWRNKATAARNPNGRKNVIP